MEGEHLTQSYANAKHSIRVITNPGGKYPLTLTFGPHIPHRILPFDRLQALHLQRILKETKL